MSSTLNNKEKMAGIVRDLWKDKDGSEMAKLEKDPKAYLKGKGVVLDSDAEVVVLKEKPGKATFHLYLPVGPDDDELRTISDGDLQSRAASSLSKSKEMF